jgi:lysozyme
MARKINAKGLALVKSFEGLSLTAYRCPANVLTIGYGSTGSHVKEGMVITEAEAEELLRKDLARFEHGVEALTEGCATLDDQFSALVSLAFNIGLTRFANSTVLKRHKMQNHLGAANAFLLWHYAAGKPMKGLMRRREAERRLYLGQPA